MSNGKKIHLINASAGSGKTYRLTNDLAGLLTACSNPVAPHKILATTFTRKAAAELKQRLRQVLLEKTEYGKAQQVLEGLVGTVNSVCGQMIMEHAVTLGLSPALDVLEEDNAIRIFKMSVAEALSDAAKDLDGFHKLAWRLGKSPSQKGQNDNSDWQQDVQNIVNRARMNGLSPNDLDACAINSCSEVDKLLPGNVDFPWDDLKNKVYEALDKLKNNEDFKPDTTKSHRDQANTLKTFLREPTWSNCAGLISLGASKKLDCMNAPGRLAADYLLPSKDLANDVKNMITKVFACAKASMSAFEKYKQEQGLIDFVDQETLLRNALKLTEKSTFNKDLKQRLQKIMVDEFQDTSPNQLDLFMKLHELAEQGSQWVGDPKQAIYGFRGTDPELMLEFTRQALANIDNSTLQYSWRSQEKLIQFVNAVFLPAFKQDLHLGNAPEDEKKVQLELPPEHQTWTGGTLEAWLLNDSKAYACLAAGIQALVQNKEQQTWRPADVAVLCRSNAHCKTLADELNNLGIAASAPRGKLLETFEGSLAMAAYRFSINKYDTTALTALVANLDLDPDWLQKLAKQSDDDRKNYAVFKAWKELPLLKKLQHLPNETNLEILERAILVLELDRRLRRYPDPARRLRNLDELRKACVTYLDECQARRSSPSPAGFVAWANAADLPEAASEDANTVNVLTYHKAKGLEWPVVILADLTQDERATPFCLRECGPQTGFDPLNPLAGRSLTYIPYPFGAKSTLTHKPEVGGEEVDLLEELLQNSELQKTVSKQERQENRRLLYVGFTRARNMLILTLNKKTNTALENEAKAIAPGAKGKELTQLKAGLMQYEATWLDDLSGENEKGLFQWPNLNGIAFPAKQALTISGEVFPFTFRICDPALPIQNEPQAQYRQHCLPAAPGPFLEYRLNPSEAKSQHGQIAGEYSLPAKLDASLDTGEYDLFGNAFHNFVALPEKLRTPAKAEALLQQWGVSNAISPEQLRTASEHLFAFIRQRYSNGAPGSVQIECEVPMTLRKENGQLYQGFIDMLIKTQDGKYVIIDHKTHSRSDDIQKYAAECYAQLAIYCDAVQNITLGKVSELLIHLPASGIIYSVTSAPGYNNTMTIP